MAGKSVTSTDNNIETRLTTEVDGIEEVVFDCDDTVEPATSSSIIEEQSLNSKTTEEVMNEQRKVVEAMRLPQAPIDRIIKEVLPSGIHVSKETRAIFSRAVSVFIICLGTAAHDSAVAAKRKGILEKDVMAALKKMHLNVPEIMTLLSNFKASREQTKQQKIDKSRTTNDDTADENIVKLSEDESMSDEVMEIEEGTTLRTDKVAPDSREPVSLLSI